MQSERKKNLSLFNEQLEEIPSDIRIQQAEDVGNNLGEALNESVTFFN